MGSREMPEISSLKNKRQEGSHHVRIETDGGVVDLEELCRHFNAFPDPVAVADRGRRIVYLNGAAEKFLGCTVRGKKKLPDCREVFRIKGDGSMHCFIDRCILEERSLHRLPVSLKSSEGESYQLSVTTTLLRDDGGRIAGCFAVLRDLHADLMAQPEIQTCIDTLASIMEHFPTPFFTVTPDLKITYMNRRLEELSGYSRQEAVGKMTCGQVLSTRHCNTKNCTLREAMVNRKPISGLRRLVRDRQGREIPVVVSASIITDIAGNVVGGFEAFRDITPIVEAEKKLEQLAEMTREGILMLDEEKRVVFANHRMAEILGISKENLMNADVSRILPPQYLEMMGKVIRDLDPGNRQTSFCSTMPFTGGSEQKKLFFETCMAVSRIGKNLVTYLYCRDITHRINIEQRLREANSFLNNIIQSSVDGIVVLDTEGNVLLFNAGAERLLGYGAEEVIGHSEVFGRLYQPDLARENMRRMRSEEYGPPGKLEPTRIFLINKDGEKVPVNFSAALIKEGDKELGSVGIFSDLREHLRIQKELEEARLQLVQAEKIASLGRLAAGVAHEINNPLAGILIYADMLVKEAGDNAQWRGDLEEIIHQTLRCKEIVTRLLEFSRQSLGEQVLLDVNETLRKNIEMLDHQSLFQDIEIVQEYDPGLPCVPGDPGQLQQVFTNLLLNAADAMEGKGLLTVSTFRDRERGTLVLRFSDTGKGIDPEMRDKIFDPFFTTKPPGKGTGLGLSIVYGVIQRHGGSIDMKSVPGKGTTFTIRLPLRNDAESANGENILDDLDEESGEDSLFLLD